MKNKNIISCLFTLMISLSLTAQTGIETTKVRGDALIDFPVGQNRGIILPKANNPTGSVGSLLYDVTSHMVSFYDGTQWIAMNTNPGPAQITLDNTGLVEEQAPTIVGATKSAADGVLILESENKALVLPWVENPHETMVRPEPGTICYDSVSKTIAVFNGTEWSFWE